MTKIYIVFRCTVQRSKLTSFGLIKMENTEDLEKYVKGTRAQLWLDNYTRKKINFLMDTGDFDSVSYLLKVAVHRMAAEYEMGGVTVTNTKKKE